MTKLRLADQVSLAPFLEVAWRVVSPTARQVLDQSATTVGDRFWHWEIGSASFQRQKISLRQAWLPIVAQAKEDSDESG